jgi:hypothetical protein
VWKRSKIVTKYDNTLQDRNALAHIIELSTLIVFNKI